MKNTLFFAGLLFSDIALSNKVVILSLVLKVIKIHFLIGLFIMFLEEVHIFLEILFVFL